MVQLRLIDPALIKIPLMAKNKEQVLEELECKPYQ